MKAEPRTAEKDVIASRPVCPRAPGGIGRPEPSIDVGALHRIPAFHSREAWRSSGRRGLPIKVLKGPDIQPKVRGREAISPFTRFKIPIRSDRVERLDSATEFCRSM